MTLKLSFVRLAFDAHAYAHAHARAYANLNTHTHKPHTQTWTYVYTYTDTPTHTDTDTHTHTRSHTYIHVHTQSLSLTHTHTHESYIRLLNQMKIISLPSEWNELEWFPSSELYLACSSLLSRYRYMARRDHELNMNVEAHRVTSVTRQWEKQWILTRRIRSLLRSLSMAWS